MKFDVDEIVKYEGKDGRFVIRSFWNDRSGNKRVALVAVGDDLRPKSGLASVMPNCNPAKLLKAA
jgi:hypothetical protein